MNVEGGLENKNEIRRGVRAYRPRIKIIIFFIFFYCKIKFNRELNCSQHWYKAYCSTDLRASKKTQQVLENPDECYTEYTKLIQPIHESISTICIKNLFPKSDLFQVHNLQVQVLVVQVRVQVRVRSALEYEYKYKHP